MVNDYKEKLFEIYRKSLCDAGLQTDRENELLCPLCWQNTSYADMSKEHVIPGAVGGDKITLTCGRCNSKHGSELDSHLSNFQALKDGFAGHGTLSAKTSVNNKRVAFNLKFGNGYKDLDVVGPASHPIGVLDLKNKLEAGNLSSLPLEILCGYTKIRFQTALLRGAYLALFERFGYKYVKHEVVQIIRRRICDVTLDVPRLGSLIGEVCSDNVPIDSPYFFTTGNINKIEFCLVIIRLRKKLTTHHFIFMPLPCIRADGFYDIMEQHSSQNKQTTFNIPWDLVF